MKPFLSVIIPTYNRAEKLEKCLHRLKVQTLNPESYEVLVVNDGSTDATMVALQSWSKTWPQLKVVHQKNAGQGTARNKALSQAEGQIILFMGDDIYASPKFLEAHVRFHEDHPEPYYAALGCTEWDTEQTITPFMKWLTSPGGHQFSYHRLQAHQELSFWYFYTSNVSLKKSLLRNKKFDTDFKGYGWEDTELGFRLAQEGLKLIYIPEAKATHNHPMKESELKTRMLHIGKNAVLFQKKHPQVPVLPKGGKKFLMVLGSRIPFLTVLFILKTLCPSWFSHPYWYVLSKRYFLQGIHRI